MKKVLITSVSAGAGHIRAAAAVEQYLRNDTANEYIIKNYDLMTFSTNWFKTVYATHYLAIINHLPTLWKSLYKLSDRPTLNINLKTRRWIEYNNHLAFFEQLKNFSPDIVISTHFMPPEILIAFKEKTQMNFKIAVVVTDFDVHYLWVHPEVDMYFVAGKKAKDKLIAYGIDENKIHISGIPVMPQFLKPSEVESLTKKWNFNPEKKRLLLMAGGAGVGGLDGLCKKILSKYPDIEVIALAGKNEKLLNNLVNIKNKGFNNLHPMGFTTEVHELMQLSDLIITKPGGLSTSECLVMKKPMLLINPIPGQEEHNAKLLTELGVAMLSKKLLVDIEYMLNNLDNFKAALNNIDSLQTEDIIRKKLQEL